MIKFAGTQPSGRKILGFGLSRGNIDKLTAAEPIHVHLDEMGLPNTELLIFFGETEEAMAKELQSLGVITKETRVNVDPKLRS